MEKKYAMDWLKDWKDSRAKTKKIESQIKLRLFDLRDNNPDIVIGMTMEKREVTASEMSDENIDGMWVSTALAYIQKIEDALAAAHPHKQLNIDFKDLEDDNV